MQQLGDDPARQPQGGGRNLRSGSNSLGSAGHVAIVIAIMVSEEVPVAAGRIEQEVDVRVGEAGGQAFALVDDDQSAIAGTRLGDQV
nr:hypothetical protein [Sphingomonas solaris]